MVPVKKKKKIYIYIYIYVYISLLIDNAPGCLRALMEMHNKINTVFMPGNTTSLLQPLNQGITLTFKSFF